LPKEQIMSRQPTFAASKPALYTVLLGLAVLSPTPARANVRTTFSPEEKFSGPPSYAFLDRPPVGEIFRDGDWVAIPFVRDPNCLELNRPKFNLLDSADPPAAFDCVLTVHGFAIWKNGPPPTDLIPIQAHYSGLGSVPVWFVRWTDLQAAIADDVLTIVELKSLPSLIVGTATFFEAVEQARHAASPRLRERQDRSRCAGYA
jgi:hypothetical protein